MQPNDYWTNATVARVNAGIKYSRMSFTELIDRFLVQNSNHFIQPNVRRRTREGISAVRTTLRLRQPCLHENPHQLPGICDRQSFAIRNLIKSQRLAIDLGSRQLDETSQAIFFVRRNLHCFGKFSDFGLISALLTFSSSIGPPVESSFAVFGDPFEPLREISRKK